MSDIKLEPYLDFNGQAREAMQFYKEVIKGELIRQSRAEARKMVSIKSEGH
jgi:uncharacterized glyoxalase superfamily protein PhnB